MFKLICILLTLVFALPEEPKDDQIIVYF